MALNPKDILTAGGNVTGAVLNIKQDLNTIDWNRTQDRLTLGGDVLALATAILSFNNIPVLNLVLGSINLFQNAQKLSADATNLINAAKDSNLPGQIVALDSLAADAANLSGTFAGISFSMFLLAVGKKLPVAASVAAWSTAVSVGLSALALSYGTYKKSPSQPNNPDPPPVQPAYVPGDQVDGTSIVAPGTSAPSNGGTIGPYASNSTGTDLATAGYSLGGGITFNLPDSDGVGSGQVYQYFDGGLESAGIVLPDGPGSADIPNLVRLLNGGPAGGSVKYTGTDSLQFDVEESVIKDPDNPAWDVKVTNQNYPDAVDYLYSFGTITLGSGNDTVIFDEGLTAADLKTSAGGSPLGLLDGGDGINTLDLTKFQVPPASELVDGQSVTFNGVVITNDTIVATGTELRNFQILKLGDGGNYIDDVDIFKNIYLGNGNNYADNISGSVLTPAEDAEFNLPVLAPNDPRANWVYLYLGSGSDTVEGTTAPGSEIFAPTSRDTTSGDVIAISPDIEINGLNPTDELTYDGQVLTGGVRIGNTDDPWAYSLDGMTRYGINGDGSLVIQTADHLYADLSGPGSLPDYNTYVTGYQQNSDPLSDQWTAGIKVLQVNVTITYTTVDVATVQDLVELSVTEAIIIAALAPRPLNQPGTTISGRYNPTSDDSGNSGSGSSGSGSDSEDSGSGGGTSGSGPISFGDNPPPAGAIVLDLSGLPQFSPTGAAGPGLGLATSAVLGDSGTRFDMNDNQFAVPTGWTGEDQGFLVLPDANGNVTNSSELLGSQEAGGFAALEALDVNGDGVLDASDPIWNQLQIWVSSDGGPYMADGSGSGELLTMAQAGITSISLAMTLQNAVQEGNQINATGSYTTASGTTGLFGEFVFGTDNFNSTYVGAAAVSTLAATLPQLPGHGTLLPLRQSMTLGETQTTNGAGETVTTPSALETAVTAAEAVFLAAAAAPSSNGLLADWRAAMQPIYDAWAATLPDNAPPGLSDLWLVTQATGSGIVVSDELLYQGGGWVFASGMAVTDPVSGDIIPNATLAEAMATPLAAGQYWTDMDAGELAFLERYDGTTFDFSDFTAGNPTDYGNLTNALNSLNQNLDQTTIRFAVQSQALSGYFAGITYDASTDTFVATTNLGMEPVYQAIFAAAPDTTAAALAYLANWWPVISVVESDFNQDSGAQLTPNYLFSNILAAWEATDIPVTLGQAALAFGITTPILTGPGVVTGTAGPDLFYVGAGNSTLVGGGDNDVFFAGSEFQDAVIDEEEAPGDISNDAIVFATLTSSQVIATQVGMDLVLSTLDGSQVIDVEDEFAWDGLNADVNPLANLFGGGLFGSGPQQATNSLEHYGVQQIMFADGVSWDIWDIAFAVAQYGLTDQVIQGTASHSVLIGGANDTLIGGGFANIFVCQPGCGFVTINVTTPEGDLTHPSNTVMFGAGISLNDLTFTRTGASPGTNAEGLVLPGNDLLITINGTSDSVLIPNQFNAAWDNYFLTGDIWVEWAGRVDTFEFADGSSISADQLNQLILNNEASVPGTPLLGTSASEGLIAGTGDRYINGLGGDDTIDYSPAGGNDTIQGDSGQAQAVLGEQTIVGGAIVPNTIDTGTISLNFTGLASSDVEIMPRTEQSDDLYLYVKPTGKTIEIANAFAGSGPRGTTSNGNDPDNFAIAFADGVALSEAQVDALLTTGTPGNDTLYGDLTGQNGSANEIFDGEGGNDKIVVTGDGAGFPFSAPTGNDSFIFNSGYGHLEIDDYQGADGTIVFGPDIAPQDVTVSADPSQDIILTIGDNGDQITIDQMLTQEMIAVTFYGSGTATGVLRIGSGGYGAGAVQFSDGTTWTQTQLLAFATFVLGTTGSDSLAGNTDLPNTSLELFDGLGGGDVVTSQDGGAYIFRPGYGTLEIDQTNDNASLANINGSQSDPADGTEGFGWGGYQGAIYFAPGISLADISGTTDPAGDVILYIGDSGDEIKIDGMLNGMNYGIGWLEFGVAFDDTPTDPGFGTSDLTSWASFDTDTWTQLGYTESAVLDREQIIDLATTIGTSGNDSLYGLAPNPTYFIGGAGYSGADYFDGHGGDDYEQGNGGSDTFVFNAGYGQLVVNEVQPQLTVNGQSGGPSAVLQMGAGIDPAQVRVSVVGDDFVLTDGISGDQITLQNMLTVSDGLYSLTWNNGVGTVEFTDGTYYQDAPYSPYQNNTVWTPSDLLRQTLASGTPGDDILIGDAPGEYFDGKGGNDYEQGAGGADTYVFNPGYGNLEINMMLGYSQATLLLGAGIDPDQVSITFDASGNMYLTDGTPGDQVRIDDALYGFESGGGLRTIQFSDPNATSWGVQDIFANELASATSGNDTLFGTTGANLFDGKGGDDYEKGMGSDTFVFNAGYGHLEIDETQSLFNVSGTGTLSLGLGIDPSNVTLDFDAAGDLYVYDGQSGDQVKIDKFVSTMLQGGGVRTIQFSDGTMWDIPAILQATLSDATTGDDWLYGSTTPMVFDGKGGDDYEQGNGGADTFVFDQGYGHLEVSANGYSGSGPMAVLQLGSGLDPSATSISADTAGDLILGFSSGDQVTVDNFFNGSAFGLVQFADGTTWDAGDIVAQELSSRSGGGTALFGTPNAELFDGGGTVRYEQGYGGADTFVFNQGYGQLEINEYDFYSLTPSAVLQLGPDIDPSRVTVTADKAGDVFLTDGVAGDQVKIDGMLSGNQIYGYAIGVAEIQFANGTTWSVPDIVQHELASATSGDDTLMGSAGAELFDGLGGDDYEQGNGGQDTFVFNPGYGDLEINEFNGYGGTPATAVLQFGAGIDPSQVHFDTPGQTILTIGSNGDQVTIDNMSPNSAYGIGSISFANGTTWSADAILAQAGYWEPAQLNGVGAYLTTTQGSGVRPFVGGTAYDPYPGRLDTLTATLQNPAGGVLTDLGGGTYNASTGVYTLTGSPDSINAALNALTFVSAIAADGQPVTSVFSVTLSFPYNGFNVPSGGGGAAIDATPPASGGTPVQTLTLFPGDTYQGTIDAGALGFTTLELAAGTQAGTLTGLGTGVVNFTTITADPGATWNLTGTNTLAAGTVLGGTGTFINTGTLVVTAGSSDQAALASLTNDGTILVQSGATLDLTGAVITAPGQSGVMLIGPDDPLELDGPVDAGQTVAFTDATGTLTLDDPAAFAGAITGFQSGDVIDLPSLPDTENASLATGHVLQVDNLDGTSESFQLAPNPAAGDMGFYVFADATGGSEIAGYAAGPNVSIGLVNDTGTSAGDGITADPALTGGGDPDATVAISSGTIAIGQTTAGSSGAWTFAPTLADGSYVLTASEADTAGTVGQASIGVVLDTSGSATPVIEGTEAGQTTGDETSLLPLFPLTVGSAVDVASMSATVTLSDPANGTLEDPNAPSDGGTVNADGSFSITGAPQAVQTALNDLIFVPTAHQIAPGQTVTTGLAVSVSTPGGATASDDTTSVLVIADADPPTITGAIASRQTTDEMPVTPFAGVTINDVDFGQTETVTVTPGGLDNGVLSDPNAATDGGAITAGVYSVTGAAAVVTAALDGLVFTPAAHQVAPGMSVTTGFTLAVTNSAGMTAAAATTSVVATAMPEAPVISGISPYTGASASGGITNAGTVAVSGTAMAFGTIDLSDNGMTAGTAVAGASGSWVETGVVLTEGTNVLTATLADDGYVSNAGTFVATLLTAPTNIIVVAAYGQTYSLTGGSADEFEIDTPAGWYNAFFDTGSGTIVAGQDDGFIGLAGDFSVSNGISAISAGGNGGVTLGGSGATLDLRGVAVDNTITILANQWWQTIYGAAGGETFDVTANGDTLTGAGGDTFSIDTPPGWYNAFFDTGSGTIVAGQDDGFIGLANFASGSGISAISAGGDGGVTLGGSGATLDLRGVAVDNTIAILANQWWQTIYGAAGGETFDVTANGDTLVGGGNDTFNVDTPSGWYNTFSDTGSGTIVAGQGNGFIGLAGDFSISNGISTIGAGGNSGVTLGGSGATLDLRGVAVDNTIAILANQWWQTIYGAAGGETFDVTANGDTLTGAGGDTFSIDTPPGWYNTFSDAGSGTIVAGQGNGFIGLAGDFSVSNGISTIGAGGNGGVTLGGSGATLDLRGVAVDNTIAILANQWWQTIYGAAGGETFDVTANGDTLVGAGNDTFNVDTPPGWYNTFSDAGSGTIVAGQDDGFIGLANFASGSGISEISANGNGGVTLGGSGATLDLRGVAVDNTIAILANQWWQTIYGAAGGETFDVTANGDTLVGAGGDMFSIDTPSGWYNTFVDTGSGTIVAGQGNGFIGLAGDFSVSNGISAIGAGGNGDVTLGGSGPTLDLRGIAVDNTITVLANQWWQTIYGAAGGETFDVTANGDTLVGGGNDTFNVDTPSGWYNAFSDTGPGTIVAGQDNGFIGLANFTSGNGISTIDLANHSGVIVAATGDLVDLSAVQIDNGSMTFLADQTNQSIVTSASGGLYELASANDTLSAGSEADTFKPVTLGVGNAVIAGFNVGTGVLDFSVVDKLPGWTAGSSATDILANAALSGGNTVISLDGYDAITLKGVAPGSLTAANFVA